MTSVPQIPGFFYDPEKRKYFKIVNGDQRLNSSYSNNTIRAKSRTDKFDRKSAQSQAKAISSLSKDAHKYKSNSLHNPLYVLLGTLSLTAVLSPRQILMDLDSFECRSSCRVWGALNIDHIIVSTPDNHIQVYKIRSFLNHGEPLIDLAFEDKIIVVSTFRQWIFLQLCHGDCHLLKWLRQNGNLRVEGRSQFLLSLLHDIRQNILLPSMRIRGKLRENNLHLLTENRWMLNINLSNFSLERRLLTNVDRPILILDEFNFDLLDEIWYFSLEKLLYVYDYHSERSLRWSFSSHINRVFVEKFEFSKHASGLDSFYQFVIITMNEVHLRTVCFKRMEVVGSDGLFSIHNNNNAKPMAAQLGSELIIEETPESYKTLHLKSLVVEDIKIPNLAAVDRSTLQIFNLGGLYVVSNHTKCFLKK